MNRSVTSAVVAVIVLATHVAPASAQTTILQACIGTCDARFPPSDYFATAIRGYCYVGCLAGY